MTGDERPDPRRPSRAHDHETTSVEAAARFERDRADESATYIGGHRFDPDDVPSRRDA